MRCPAAANSAREPVVKSCSRVPTARITSASAASALAAPVPVTPMPPMFIGCEAGSEDLPAWVSAAGKPCAAAKRASAASASE